MSSRSASRPGRVAATAAGLSVAVAALGLTAGPASAQETTVAVRTAVPAGTASAATVGHPAATSQVDVKLYLAGRDQAGAEALVRQVSDPKSAVYGHYLSAAQVQREYAPSAAEVAGVTAFLKSSGLAVRSVGAGNLYVEASGSVAEVEKAFATTLVLKQVGGHQLRVATSQAKLPAALAHQVVAVTGLSTVGVLATTDRTTGADQVSTASAAATTTTAARSGTQAPPPAAFVNAGPCSSYYNQLIATMLPSALGGKRPYATCGYVPSQLQGAYGVSGLVDHGFDGRGVSVAIVDAYDAPTIQHDANIYAVKHGQPGFAHDQYTTSQPSGDYRYGYDDTVNGDLCGEQGWYGEQTLDVEAVHAMAPGASITYVPARSCDNGDFLDALARIVDRHIADIVTNSWGSTGESYDALTAAYHQVFLAGALEGIGFYFSSGDSGDESTATSDGSAAVNSPASDPLVTAVGGTSIGIGRTDDYEFETGWSTGTSVLSNGAWTPSVPGPYQYGGGGGTSRIWTEPWYQQGVVPTSIAKRYGPQARAVPDIAAIGDPNTGMLVGETQTFSAGYTKYSEYRIGGTSLSSPIIAGVMAITQQVSGRVIGFANPAIYALNGTSALHDVQKQGVTRAVVRNDYLNGENASDGIRTSLRSLNVKTSIFVRKGYDDVTGVGTPNGLSFITRLGVPTS